MTLVLFRCLPLNTALTRVSCGKRHLEANVIGKGGNSKPLVRDETCRTCMVGAAHSREEKPKSWPDGAPIAVAIPGEVPPAAKPSAAVLIHREQLVAKVKSQRVERASVPVPTTKESAVPQAKLITFNGKSQTISQWGRDLMMSSAAITGRIQRATAKGSSYDEAVAEALTKPRDPAQPTTRSRSPESDDDMDIGGPPRPTARARTVTISVDSKSAADQLRAIEELAATVPHPIETLSPAAFLTTAGFKVLNVTKVPAGYAIFVEAP